MEKLEDALNKFVQASTPRLPAPTRKAVVGYVPWLDLLLGLITLWAAYELWHWAHYANQIINYANSLSRLYGGTPVVQSRLTSGIWLSILVLVIEALLYLAAYSGLKSRKKAGWNILFYALLFNILYGVVVMFTSYGSIGSFVASLLGSAVGLYFLFQIRSSYLGNRSVK